MGRSLYILLIELIDGADGTSTINEIRSYYDDYSPRKGDSGVDLYMPRDVVVKARSFSTKIPLGVKVSMRNLHATTNLDKSRWMASDPVACGLYARSSTGLNTPVRLSNHVGIIDAGYRGELAVVVDNLSDEDFTLKAGERYFQLCSGNLKPVSSVLVCSLDEETERGAGGFGSTNA